MDDKGYPHFRNLHISSCWFLLCACSVKSLMLEDLNLQFRCIIHFHSKNSRIGLPEPVQFSACHRSKICVVVDSGSSLPLLSYTNIANVPFWSITVGWFSASTTFCLICSCFRGPSHPCHDLCMNSFNGALPTKNDQKCKRWIWTVTRRNPKWARFSAATFGESWWYSHSLLVTCHLISSC